MEIKKAEFIISAVKKDQYPKDNLPEVAFVGRSNAGKSSLINTLTNRKKLAKTSSTPGKTRLVNFFLINEDLYFVDLPGYGYAKVSKKEKESWVKVIETYLIDREPLGKVVLLVDCRHKPTGDDIMMYNWIRHYNYKPIVVATKADKISNNELFKNLKVIRETLGMTKEEQIIKFSSLKKVGVQELIKAIYE
ncbi:ribosome biogenesis GTP-binding protein YihA/YsxC [Haloimpatiens massiliensis]|uniref:ribosome biogenesis GTP-binding protein YihA/YsxC n=1 Tax=Haloimpatiens massiliensis TaxID=1658110 RepID=UPI000C84B85C|nr:ribosome biogenesis GTP-binding protein YihA/YsxC [Haloimpatiens massiliensis]